MIEKIRIWSKAKKIMYDPEVIDLFMDFKGNMYQQVFSEDEMEVVACEPLNKEDFIKLQYSGDKDKNGKEIFEGDIIRLVNEELKEIIVICKFGKTKREIYGNLVEITGFYYERVCDGLKSFTIVNNYAGKHDLDLFEVIGNIYENLDLIDCLS